MAPYARVEVALILVLGGLATWLTASWLGWWGLVPAVAAWALLSFYRDPPRTPPARDDVLVSPADGRVVTIERRPGPGGRDELRIVVFLSVMNVHVNRSPCAGRVVEVVYQPGKFRNALKPESTTENENNLIVLEPAAPLPGPLRVRQIAGVLARRIVCAVRPGDALTAGQRIGMIKLGSRTELCASDADAWQVEVQLGQPVYGGTTILATLKPGRGG
jgi:phosphatidylserine decarboxylase